MNRMDAMSSTSSRLDCMQHYVGTAEPDAPVMSESPGQALNGLINSMSQTASPGNAQGRPTALTGLANSYDMLPKDQNGYVTKENLQQVADNSGSYLPEAMSAAAYFLDPENSADFNSLETSRQKYEEGVTVLDGEVSREDIVSGLNHLDISEQEPAPADGYIDPDVAVEPSVVTEPTDDAQSTMEPKTTAEPGAPLDTESDSTTAPNATTSTGGCSWAGGDVNTAW